MFSAYMIHCKLIQLGRSCRYTDQIKNYFFSAKTGVEGGKGQHPDPPIDLLDSCVNMINMIRHHVKPHVTKLQKCYKTKKMLQNYKNVTKTTK